MLVRLASVFVSFGLLGTAGGGTFASPPPEQRASIVVEDRAEVPSPMPVRALPDRASVRKALEARRTKNLAAFRAYRKGGVYPHNRWRMGPLNVWIDTDGHLCAAATMIGKDGKEALVRKTAETDNNIRLQNVIDGELLDWMLTSGFTIEEIDRIQAPSIYPDESMMKTEDALRAEDARLSKLYAETDAALVKQSKRGLDTATDRLMKNPALAWRLLDGTL